MAKIMLSQKRAPRFGSVPYGNQSFLPMFLKTNAEGAVLDAGAAPAPAVVNDKIYIGTLPAGFLKDELTTVVSLGFTADTTVDIGFEYMDGEDDTKLPQSATYYGAGVALDAIARLQDTGTQEPIPLPKDIWVVLTVKGAASAKAGSVSFHFKGEQR